jgi:hypothetical protein
MSDEKQITLDDVLNQTLDAASNEPVSTDIKTESVTEKTDSVTETAEAKAQRERDERGRFKAKSEEIATPAALEAPAEPVASTELPTQDAKPEAPKVSEGHFRGWSPDQRAQFDTLPPEAQDVVLALKRDTDSFYTRKLEEAAQTKKQLEPVAQLLNETADVFAAQGMSPVQAIQGYANIERALTYGTLQEKLDLLGAIAKQYGIPFAPQQQVDQLDPYEYQKFQMLHDRDAEIQKVKAENARIARENNEFKQQQLAQQVETFSRATLPDGSAKYPLFETVKPSMGALLASGRATTLEQAYELASQPIQQAIEAREAKARADAERSRLESVERAKRAAPVKASSAQPSGRTSAPKGIDAVLNSALDQMGL